MATLFANPRYTPVDAQGDPYPGATLTFYAAGTTTPQAVYTTSALTTPHPSPVTANSAGQFPAIYYDDALQYRAILRDATGVLLWDIDTINSSLTAEEVGRALYTRTTAEISANVTPTAYRYPPGDIRRYGAIGNDSTDCTAFVQAAVNQAGQSGGAPVYVPPGTFRIGQVSLLTGVTIYGDGYRSCLKAAPSANNYLLANTNGTQYVDDVVIKGIRVDGNKTNQTSGGGIYCNGRRNIITNNYVHDTNDASILFGCASAGATNVPDASVIISNNIVLNPGDNNSWGGIAITHCRQAVVADNLVISTDGQMTYGIDLEPELGNTCDLVSITGNTIRGGRIFVDGANLGAGNFVSRVTVTDNTVDARGSFGPSNTNAAPIWIRQVRDATISGNTCYGHSSAVAGGLFIESAGISATNAAENITITGNTFRADVKTDAYAFYADDLVNGIVTGNIFETNSTDATAKIANSTNVRFSANSFNNAGAGGSLQIQSGCTNVYSGVDNYYKNPPSNSSSPSCIIERTPLIGSVTWNPGSILDGDEEETTITVTGAALGDFVAVSFSVDVLDLAVSAQVTAADTVSVSLLNNTGGAVDVASGTVRARVFKVV